MFPPLVLIGGLYLARNPKLRNSVSTYLKNLGGGSPSGGNATDQSLARMRQNQPVRAERPTTRQVPPMQPQRPANVAAPAQQTQKTDYAVMVGGYDIFAECVTYDYFQKQYYKYKEKGQEINPWEMPPEKAPWEQ